MSTIRLRQAARPPILPRDAPRKPPPRFGREAWWIGAALLLIITWGWIGVDRTVLDELSSTMTSRERRALAQQELTLPLLPGPVHEKIVAGIEPGEAGFDTQPFDAPSPELAARGETVFQDMGCYACHSIDGSAKIGPSLLGLWGTDRALVDGSTTVMDDAYFRESILEPQARIVEGFADAAMPTYDGLVSDDDIEALAAYVQSLR